MEVTTEQQKWPKISTNSNKLYFLPEVQKKPQPKPSAGVSFAASANNLKFQKRVVGLLVA